MSAPVEIGQHRVFRSVTTSEIEITERLTEGEFAGEFRYRYVGTEDDWGILPAEELERSTYLAPTSTPGDAVKDAAPASSGAPNSIVELDQQQALDSLIANVLAWANGPVGHKALDGALRLAAADYERVMGL